MKKKAIIKIEQVEEKILKVSKRLYYRIGKQRVRNFAVKNFDRKTKFHDEVLSQSLH